MSIGNLKDQGNKGNNFPYQLRTLQLLGEINAGIAALPGVDYETRTTTYQATANGTGYSSGNIIVRYDIIDVAASTLAATVWFNQTLQATILAPLPGDLTPISAPSGVTVLNGPAGAAVNIQDGGNSITIDAISLPLPTGAATEITLASVDTKLTAAVRTPNILRDGGIGATPAGVYSFSIANVGTADGTIDGQSISAGVTVNFDAGSLNNILASLPYDATGTAFLITWIS